MFQNLIQIFNGLMGYFEQRNNFRFLAPEINTLSLQFTYATLIFMFFLPTVTIILKKHFQL